MRFCRRREMFIFHPILKVIFSFDSSQWELSVVCQRIFSIWYRFRAKRVKVVFGWHIQLLVIIKKDNFDIIFLLNHVNWNMGQLGPKTTRTETTRTDYEDNSDRPGKTLNSYLGPSMSNTNRTVHVSCV